MKKPFNTLRMHRKQSNLTQADLAFLLNHTDNSFISRCENGERQVTIEILIAYHLLFGAAVSEFFVDQRTTVQSRIASRIKPLVAQLEKEQLTPKGAERIAFLLQFLRNLSSDRP
ncbi:MAG: helix-turn-helix domain-containing protein [Flavobacteriales bacterium]|nr:helix-turn-helix domain-containing protein [Flavobacteriales bacterium]